MKLYSEIAKDKTEMPASMKAVRLLNIVQIQALETYIFQIKQELSTTALEGLFLIEMVWA